MAVRLPPSDEAFEAAHPLSAGLIDLCEILARPSAYLNPAFVTPYLTEIGFDLNDDDPELPEQWIDDVLFDQLMSLISDFSEEEWSTALVLSRETSPIPLIATSPFNALTHFALSAAAACLHIPIGRNVLKQKINQISSILGADASKIAFGEAQFLYKSLGEFDEATNIYETIFQTNLEDTSAYEALIKFGHHIIFLTLKAESRLWAEVYSFRISPAGYNSDFNLGNFSAQQRSLVLRLWERKWKKWQNS
jgi:hypothetical protein